MTKKMKIVELVTNIVITLMIGILLVIEIISVFQ